MSRGEGRRAILLIDHGSRKAEAHTQLAELAELVSERRPDCFVTCAHMEFGAPDVAQGVALCVAEGAREIIIHPYFLNTGLHVQETLPALIEAAAKVHPGVRIRLSAHLGLHDGLVQAVLDRIDETSDT